MSTPSRDIASTTIPATRPSSFLSQSNSTAVPSSTVFGTFHKQTPIQRSTFPAANNSVKPGIVRGVQQKMRSNGNGHNMNNGHNGRPTTSNGMTKEAVYRPESLASSAPTQKTYEKLAEVYSSSDDTVQFAGNLRTFISERVPYGVWMGIGVLEILFGLIILFIGALNLPMCEIQPMIPVYLLCSGAVLIVHGLVRIFASIPSPPPSTRRPRSTRSKLNRDLCLYAIEGIVLLAMIVVVILGCVWVYGARYVHFHEGLFEEDYCNGFIYWAAWWDVTLHLVILSLVILALIIILIYGSCVSS